MGKEEQRSQKSRKTTRIKGKTHEHEKQVSFGQLLRFTVSLFEDVQFTKVVNGSKYYAKSPYMQLLKLTMEAWSI